MIAPKVKCRKYLIKSLSGNQLDKYLNKIVYKRLKNSKTKLKQVNAARHKLNVSLVKLEEVIHLNIKAKDTGYMFRN